MCHTLGTQCHTLRPHNVTHFAHTMYHTVSHTLDTQQTLPVEMPGQAEDKGTGSSPLLPGCRCADGILVAEDHCKILCPALPPGKGVKRGFAPFAKYGEWNAVVAVFCYNHAGEIKKRDSETAYRDDRHNLPGTIHSRILWQSSADTGRNFPANMITIRLTKI